MILKYDYWYFKSVVDPKVCERIIKLGTTQKFKEARVGIGTNKTLPKKLSTKARKFLDKTRSSSVTWLSDPWLYDLLIPYIRAANTNAGWNFDFDWFETFQLTKYKKGDFYNWHPDMFKEPYDKLQPANLIGKVRKLTFVLILNTGYKGGNLELKMRNFNTGENEDRIIREVQGVGNILIFPSFIFHRVRPILQGLRYSLIGWAIGNPFK
jgi:PKHD-type hydroxylase